MKDREAWFEFLKITTTGPPHLRLNCDLRQLIHEIGHRDKEILKCSCGAVLLIEREGKFMQIMKYYLLADAYFCRDCSPWSDDSFPWHVGLVAK